MYNFLFNGTVWKTAILGVAALVTILALIQMYGDLSETTNQSVFAQQSVKTINVGRIPTGIVIDEVENKAYVANYKSHSISVIDGSTYTVDSFSVPAFPRNMALDASSDILYVSHNMNKSVSVIDLRTRQVTDTIPVGAGPEQMALDTDSSKLYVVNRGSDTIHIIDTTNNSALKTVNVGKHPRDIAINPKTSKVYVAVSDSYKNHYVSIIDANTDSVITTIPTKGASAVSVDQNNNLVYVTAGGANLMYIIHGSTDSVLRVMDTGRYIISDVLVTSTPRKVLVAHLGSDSIATFFGPSHSFERNVIVGESPLEMAVNTPAKEVYTVNHLDDTVSVFNLLWR